MMVTTVTKRFDQEMYSAALRFYGLPDDYNRTFTSIPRRHPKTHALLVDVITGRPLTTLVSCDSALESVQGRAIWVQVNLPFPHAALTAKGHPKKACNDEIERIMNVTLDFEYPGEPQLAHAIGKKLVEHLVLQDLAMQELPLEDSGAGCHIVLPIRAIVTTRETAKRWNDAVAAVVKRYIKPAFCRFVQQAGIAMDVGGFDISRVLSVPGTWRPPNPQKNDCPPLQQGYLRRWLPPYINGCYPFRVESIKLSQLIRIAYLHLTHQPEIPPVPSQQAYTTIASTSPSPAQWLANYAAQKPQGDRSALFQSLVSATYLKYGESTVLELKETIHQLSGEKYSGRLDTEIQRSLAVAKKLSRDMTYQAKF